MKNQSTQIGKFTPELTTEIYHTLKHAGFNVQDVTFRNDECDSLEVNGNLHITIIFVDGKPAYWVRSCTDGVLDDRFETDITEQHELLSYCRENAIHTLKQFTASKRIMSPADYELEYGDPTITDYELDAACVHVYAIGFWIVELTDQTKMLFLDRSDYTSHHIEDLERVLWDWAKYELSIGNERITADLNNRLDEWATEIENTNTKANDFAFTQYMGNQIIDVNEYADVIETNTDRVNDYVLNRIVASNLSFNQMLITIQTLIGSMDGGVASIHFSGVDFNEDDDEPMEWHKMSHMNRLKMMMAYMETERSYDNIKNA